MGVAATLVPSCPGPDDPTKDIGDLMQVCEFARKKFKKIVQN